VKRLFFVFVVFLFVSSVYAQGSVTFKDAPFIIEIEKDITLQQWLDTNAFYHTVLEEQKEAVYWINYVRKYPKLFHDKVLIPFLEQFPEVKSSYSKSLSEKLLSMAPVGLLIPDEKLTKIAAEHAADLGKHGANISHNATSGLNFQQRMNKAGYFSNVSENIFEGKNAALESLIFLLIDPGVKDVGHRENILSKNMKKIGVSYYPIAGKSNMYFFVQDFWGE
jgi:hypothetical protein